MLLEGAIKKLLVLTLIATLLLRYSHKSEVSDDTVSKNYSYEGYYGVQWIDERKVIHDIININQIENLNEYYAQTINRINNYFDESDNYYLPSVTETCPYGLCNSAKSVNLYYSVSNSAIDYLRQYGEYPQGLLSTHDLPVYFYENDMDTEQIIRFMNEHEHYAFRISINIYISVKSYLIDMTSIIYLMTKKV